MDDLYGAKDAADEARAAPVGEMTQEEENEGEGAIMQGGDESDDVLPFLGFRTDRVVS